jgi:hypothetical protein
MLVEGAGCFQCGFVEITLIMKNGQRPVLIGTAPEPGNYF